MEPVTQQFSLSWKPEVRFLERRLDPLKKLDERGEVRSFQVQQPDIVVTIENRYQEIRYGSTGISVRLADPLADSERAFAAVAEVFEIFEPEHLGLARANFQFLTKLDGHYTELRSDWSKRFFEPGKGATISDWALLLNADINATLPWAGALEFGIVSDEEVVERLGRELGRMRSQSPGQVSDRIDIPSVGFFADSEWASATSVGDEGDGLLQATIAAWTTIREKVSGLVSRIESDYSGVASK